MGEKAFVLGCGAEGRERLARLVRVAAVATAALVLAGCAAELTWTEFEAQSGQFSVEMPGIPDMDEVSIPTPEGDLDLSMATVEIDDSAFAATESVFPVGFPISLAGAADGAVANSMTGSITSSSEVDVDNVPCLRFSAAGETDGQGVEMESIVCQPGDRLVQLVVVNGDDNRERTDRFINSLSFAG